ncbi:MAG: rRNA maturation RNase YbeY [Candidatus Omnitrophica bacterium]|nr:rRNA maturation RNase YbeY [Candidatus Omnitrophota bacterium]
MKVVIQNLRKKIPLSRQKIKRAVLEALASEGVEKTGQINVCFLSDKAIRKLNKRFFKLDTPTDVIAFDISAGGLSKELSADIAISVDTAISNSRIYKTSLSYEISLYIIHGVLHILGYDDKREKSRRLMQRKAEDLLDRLKV